MSPLLLLLLALPARAAEPAAELETVAQLRHDLWGEPTLPLWSYLRYAKEVHGAVAQGFGVDAYLGLAWEAGLDQPSDLDVYDLQLEGEQRWGRWVLGRQRATAALRPQTFDGARLDWRASESLGLSLWAGEARHQDLDDLRDGLEMGRLDATLHRGALVARGGVQLESGKDSPLALRQDAEARLRGARLKSQPDARLRFVLAEARPEADAPMQAAVELAEAELGVRPVAALRTSLHASHREAADPTALFGEAILDHLASGAVDRAGAGLRLSGARHAALYARWSLVRTGPENEPWTGHEVDLSWSSPLGDRPLRLSPGYLFRSGSGGAFHAPSLAARLALGDRASVGARAAVAPYRSHQAPWQLVSTAALDGSVRPASWVGLDARLEACSDALMAFDLRGTAVLTLAVP